MSDTVHGTAHGSVAGLGEETRSDFLTLAGTALGTAGAAVAIWPLIDSMNPAEDVLALASSEIDLSAITVGQRVTASWRDKPIFIDRRTKAQIDRVRAGTHLGGVPFGRKPARPHGGSGERFCPCHGPQYDASGRIRKGPAPRNLKVPPYSFLNDHTLRIG